MLKPGTKGRHRLALSLPPSRKQRGRCGRQHCLPLKTSPENTCPCSGMAAAPGHVGIETRPWLSLATFPGLELTPAEGLALHGGPRAHPWEQRGAVAPGGPAPDQGRCQAGAGRSSPEARRRRPASIPIDPDGGERRGCRWPPHPCSEHTSGPSDRCSWPGAAAAGVRTGPHPLRGLSAEIANQLSAPGSQRGREPARPARCPRGAAADLLLTPRRGVGPRRDCQARSRPRWPGHARGGAGLSAPSSRLPQTLSEPWAHCECARRCPGQVWAWNWGPPGKAQAWPPQPPRPPMSRGHGEWVSCAGQGVTLQPQTPPPESNHHLQPRKGGAARVAGRPPLPHGP